MEPQVRFVLEHFNNATGKFFVDVGANDGITISNSYELEKSYGWCGLCLEPHPTAYAKLVKNRKCKCLNVAANDKTEIVEFTQINGYSEMLSGIKSTYDPRHAERINNEWKQYKQTYENINIQARKLQDIFYDELIYIVDYLSVDTEGSELNILKGIDFNKVSINLISLEDNFSDKLDEYRRILEPHNFKYLGTVGLDRFFGK